jgi:hypothetical protein
MRRPSHTQRRAAAARRVRDEAAALRTHDRGCEVCGRTRLPLVALGGWANGDPPLIVCVRCAARLRPADAA